MTTPYDESWGAHFNPDTGGVHFSKNAHAFLMLVEPKGDFDEERLSLAAAAPLMYRKLEELAAQLRGLGHDWMADDVEKVLAEARGEV